MHSNLQFLGWVGAGLYLVVAAAFIVWLATKARGARRKLGVAGLSLLILGSLISLAAGLLYGIVGMAIVFALSSLVAKASPAGVRA